MGMQVGYVPFQMHGPEGAAVGLDVDLAEMVSRCLNVNLRIVSQTWQELIPSLLEGATDVVMSGMTVTPERNAQVMFTLPVMETGRMFLVHVANAESLRRIQDLDQPGIFVVSWPGSLGQIRLKELLPEAAHRQFAERKLALAEVLEKRAHAMIDEEFSIRLACATYSDKLVSSFKPITCEQVAWAIRPNDPHWLNWLDNFIRTIQKDGRLDDLKAKWLRDYFLDIRGQKSPR